MSNTNQKQIFKQGEGDAWFRRNQEQLIDFSENTDHILSLIDEYQLGTKMVLEVGCASGYRLDAIRRKWGAKVYGVEPSKEAVEFGENEYSLANLNIGTADDLSQFGDNLFDLIIVNVVFHWIDGPLLLKAVAEIDRVLINKGHLIIGDFDPNSPLRNPYHHLEGQKVFTYKQDYAKIFLSSAFYHLVHKVTVHHQNKELQTDVDANDRWSYSLIRKDLSNAYLG